VAEDDLGLCRRIWMNQGRRGSGQVGVEVLAGWVVIAGVRPEAMIGPRRVCTRRRAGADLLQVQADFRCCR
jgi:hypothetical protein